MRDYFNQICQWMRSQLTQDELFCAYFSGESSDFIRLNKGKVRQAGHVKQAFFNVDWIQGKKHVQWTISLSGNLEQDQARLIKHMEKARQNFMFLEEDPYLLYNEQPTSSCHIEDIKLPDTKQVLSALIHQVEGLDFVGIYASGIVERGFFSSLGQSNWFCVPSFHLDFSLYDHGDKAVKGSYGGSSFKNEDFFTKLETLKAQLAILKKPAKTISKGDYKVYLAPSALEEIMTLLNWNAFSEKSLKTKMSSLQKMRDEEARLSGSVNIYENTQAGFSPHFSTAGFIKPQRIRLIEKGSLVGSLVSGRSAKEYNLAVNANENETLESIEVGAGELLQNDILKTLHTGVFINNLWYLNYSDRALGRMTGMTRFGTFWVEGGEIVAPLNTMRFDDSIYRILGSELLGLTKERETILDAQTYEERSTKSMLLPGALIDQFRFVL